MDDHYQCASGGVIAGGMSILPNWYKNAAVNQWIELPNSTLFSSGIGWSGGGIVGDYRSVVNAYSGGILNTVGVMHAGEFIPGVFLVLFGGGHSDYSGNELYAYGPINTDSPIWRRLTDPTLPAPMNVLRIGSNPVSRHTYDSIVYLPTINKMLCFGAPGSYYNGNSLSGADLFDFSATSNQWSNLDTDFPAFNGGGAGTSMLVSGYDSITRKAWGLGCGNGQALGCYSVDSGTWSSYAKNNPNGTSSSKAGLSSSLGLLVFIKNSTIYVQNLAAPTNELFSPSVTGTAPDLGQSGTIDWDEATHRFILHGSGKTIYFLTPGANPILDAWAWSSNTPANGATPANGVAAGTYGRFRFCANLRGVILMPAYDAPICFYKMV